MHAPAAQPRLLVVHFLIPIKDRDGQRYPRQLHDDIRLDCEQRFGGWSRLSNAPLPGAWTNPETGQIERDESYRYEVGIKPGQLSALDDFLADLAVRIGQEAVWRVAYAGGEAKAIPARKSRK